MELFLDFAAGLQRVLVLGRVSKIDPEALAGGEHIDLKPGIAAKAEDLEGCRALTRHSRASLVTVLRAAGVQKGLPYVHAEEVAPFGNLHLGPRVEVSDAPVSINDDDAVCRALEYRRDPSRCLLRRILCFA